jgi:type II secretory pathway component GspD/PulD (secretin)
MKIPNIFAVIVAVLVTCLAAIGQDQPAPQPNQPPPPVVPPAPTPGTSTNTPVPAPEPPPPPLPAGRTVSYSPLVGIDPLAATNPPVAEGEPADVSFTETDLTDAVRALALQAGLNIQFDPTLLVSQDGHPVPPPQVTVKWHNLTAVQALHALLDNYGWQLYWDPRSKVGRIGRKNPAAAEPLIISVYQLSYSDPSNIVKEVQGTLSAGSAIIPDLRTHQLVIRTTERELPGVQALIKKLDAATRQILVEAKIIETSKDITSAKGVDWTGTLASQHVSFGNGLTQGTTATGSAPFTNSAGGSTVSPGGSSILGGAPVISQISSNVPTYITTITGNTSQGGGFSMNTAHGYSPATAFLNADGVSAVLSFLNTDADTKTIAFPRSVALDGEPTTLMVVENVPVFVQTQSAPAAGAVAGLATIQPNYDLLVAGTILNEVGVKLVVTPRIAGLTNVLLDLKPEISQQGPTVTETLNGQPNQAPTFNRSRLTTRAAVPSGYTLVLGGMDQDVVGKTYTKVPFFGDIPGLGSLFRSDSKSHAAQTTLIFVTPTIVGDTDFQLANSKFLKRKPLSASEVNEAPWDTGEPYDWTKPSSKVSPEYQP